MRKYKVYYEGEQNMNLKMKKWKLAGIILSGCIGLLLPKITTSAETINQTEMVYEINEAYQGIYTEEDVKRFIEDEVIGLKITDSDDIPYFTEYKDIVDFVKGEMINRKTEIVFSMPNTANIYSSLKKDVLSEKNSTSFKDGDYLLANIVGRNYKIDREEEIATYYLTVIYTSTLEQEAEVDVMLPKVLKSLELDGKSNYEKIKIIHDYIVNHITYTQNDDYECHSTYAALIKGEAVCQGYASLFYRLCKEIGIECRYITGTAFEPHAWNIVKLEEKWYNVDCTWDDQDNGEIYYDFFLKSEEDFWGHERYSQFSSDEFMTQYPMANISYETCVVKELEENNLSMTFNTIGEKEVSATAGDTVKILFFYDNNNGRCVKQLKDYAACDWIKDYEFVAIDGKRNDKDTVKVFMNTYGLNNFTFCYDESEDTLNTMKSYCEMASIEYSEFFPYIVMIDSDNKVRQMVSGYYTVEELKTALDKLKKTEQIPTNPVEPEKPEEPKPVEPVEPIEPVEPENPQPTPTDHPFTDVPASGWKAEAVSYVYHNAIMNGISGTTLFEPDNTLTRGMFATILYRIAGSPAVTYEARFTDVPDGKWFSNAIIWAADEGIVNGFGDGTYGVNTDITREQVIKMIGVFASKMGNSVSSSNDLSSFEDMNSVSLWARGYVGWAVDNGIISGRPTENGGYRVDPKGTATRAECAKMVSKFMENL